MMQVNRKYAFWILVFVAASLITVLFLGQAGISDGNLIFVIASLLFYAVPIAIVVCVIRPNNTSIAGLRNRRWVVEMDAKMELLKQQIERVAVKVDEIAGNRG